MTNLQGVSDSFDLDKLIFAQNITKQIVQNVSTKFEVGMCYEDCEKIYLESLTEHSIVERQWHPHKIRLGANTKKIFREKNDTWQIASDDIFFIDIGLVINGHESDYAQTFTIGNNKSHFNIIDSSIMIHKIVKDYFYKNQNVSGLELYQYAQEVTKEYGYILDTREGGHRIGDYPHAKYHKGSLIDLNETIIANRWILEIMLIDEKNNIGAFYEDIL